MVLLATVPGAFVTQRFGRSALGVEPSMWYVGEKAYWLPFLGASFSDNFHPGIDRSAAFGTPVLAMESGVVVFAAFKDGISGKQVEIEIRENTRYSVNHLSIITVRVGQHVDKGDMIGRVGTTGATTGPHTHEGLSIREKDSNGVFRTFLYNPELFMPGGKYADDVRVKPEARYIVLNGPGINLRDVPLEFNDKSDVFAKSMEAHDGMRAGIFRLGTGNRIGPLNKRFRFIRWAETENGTFAVVAGFRRRLGIRKSLIHFVD